MNLFIRSILLLISLSLILMACGGGGGDEEEEEVESFFDIIQVTGNQTRISPQGGIYKFDNGVSVEVPAGAVSTTQDVTIELLDSAGAQRLLDESGMTERVFMAGADFSPHGLKLNSPIRVSLPATALPAGDEIPIHFRHDETNNAFYPADTDIIVSPADSIVTLTLSDFSHHAVAGVKDELAKKCIEAGEDPCRCGRIQVLSESRATEYESPDGSCTASSNTGFVFYLECSPPTIESWGFVEHSDGCVPKMTLTPGKTVLAPGETTAVEARLTYGGEPVLPNNIALSANDLLNLSTSAVTTGFGGEASFNATAGNTEGAGVITGVSTVDYAPLEIAVNGQVEEMVPRQKTVSSETAITIDAPYTLEIGIVPGVNGNYLVPGEQTLISVFILDPAPSDGTTSFVPSVDVLLSASSGSLGAPSVRTSSVGEVIVPYTAPSAPGVVSILGDAVLALDLDGVPVVYTLAGQDSIEVRDVTPEHWAGTLTVRQPVSVEGEDRDSAEMTLTMNFILEYNPAMVNPGLTNPNVTGTGEAQVSLVTTDGPMPAFGQIIYVNAAVYPFTASLSGVVDTSAGGKELHLLVRHPQGNGALIAEVVVRELTYDSEGVVINNVFWDAPQWLWHQDIDGVNEDDWSPIRIDLTEPGIIETSGECLLEMGHRWPCTYTLALVPQ